MIETEIAKVDNIKEPDKPWVLRWKSAAMTAPAFWYFATEEEAKKVEAEMKYTSKENDYGHSVLGLLFSDEECAKIVEHVETSQIAGFIFRLGLFQMIDKGYAKGQTPEETYQKIRKNMLSAHDQALKDALVNAEIKEYH